jgi:hypothetical protein
VNGKYAFEVQTLPLDQLTKHIDFGQIPQEFGGQLHYNHTEWIDIRRTIEGIILRINEILHQFEEYSVKIRACALPSDLNGHSPDRFFDALRQVETSLQSIRGDGLDNAISMVKPSTLWYSNLFSVGRQAEEIGKSQQQSRFCNCHSIPQTVGKPS